MTLSLKGTANWGGLFSISVLNYVTMKCERCGENTSVDRYGVDGFTGYLCHDCKEVWEILLEG